MFHLQKDDFPVDTHVSSLLIFMVLYHQIYFLWYSNCLWRCLRLQRLSVGYQLWLRGTRHIFILTNVFPMTLSLIWTVFFSHMVRPVVNVLRKWVWKISTTLVLYCSTAEILSIQTLRMLMTRFQYNSLVPGTLFSFLSFKSL